MAVYLEDYARGTIIRTKDMIDNIGIVKTDTSDKEEVDGG